MIKIIKIRPYRINFIRNGLHYSLNDIDEIFEDGMQLQCKENEYYRGFWGKRVSDVLFECGWSYKQGKTYKDFDVDRLEEVVFGDKY